MSMFTVLKCLQERIRVSQKPSEPLVSQVQISPISPQIHLPMHSIEERVTCLDVVGRLALLSLLLVGQSRQGRVYPGYITPQLSNLLHIKQPELSSSKSLLKRISSQATHGATDLLKH